MKSKSVYKECASDATVPAIVRKRCELVVRDMDRLIDIADTFAKSGNCFITDGRPTSMITQETAARASEELRCVQEALDAIPEVYRQGILNNIRTKTPFSDIAHPNTWKKWKKSFICELARNLHLI